MNGVIDPLFRLHARYFSRCSRYDCITFLIPSRLDRENGQMHIVYPQAGETAELPRAIRTILQ